MEAEEMDVEVAQVSATMAKLWWVWLLAGIVWIILSIAILRANTSSITVFGIIIGIMFVLAGLQQFFIAAVVESWRWVWILFGILFLAGGIIMMAYPNKTFVGFAQILGWVFLVFGVLWIIEAFEEKATNDLWWFLLIAGILMVVLAFWASAQFLVTKGYVLLIFGGVWAVLHGITDLMKAFHFRKVGKSMIIV